MSQAALNARYRGGISKKTDRNHSNSVRLVGFIFLLMVTGIVLGSGWIVMNLLKDVNRFPLSKLVVTGERYYTTLDDIRQAILASGSPGTFITQDVSVVLQQIERLPWIKQASVRKQWPDKLSIHVVEYVPVARWNDVYLVDIKGKSFSVHSGGIDDSKLPLLYGPEGSEQDVLAGYLEIKTALAASKFTLRMVSMSARRSWQLLLENGIRLELGREDFPGRLKRFIALYPILQQKTDQQISYVDLRYDTGAAVGWAPILLGKRQQSEAQVK